ncbi:hypothetical protein CMR93_06745 [Escherichia coli]|nr:hypothetical protein CMR93_06745 [Escherichia coli]
MVTRTKCGTTGSSRCSGTRVIFEKKNASRSGWHFAFRMYTMRQKSYATAASTSTGTITLA